MKKIQHISIFTFLIIGLLIGTAHSCKKEEVKNPNTANPNSENSIIGKWTLVAYEISNFENSGITIDDTEDVIPRPTVEFKINGTCLIKNFDDENASFNYEIVGEKIFFDGDISFGLGHSSFYYTLSKNQLILTRTDTYFYPNYIEETKVTLVR